MEINHGYIKDERKPEDYIFGASSLSQEILQEDGQWDKFLPPDDFQCERGVETYNCSGYGTAACLEILMRRLFNAPASYSERYIGICAGTNPEKGGNSPQTVIETIRKKCGVIPDEMLPFAESIKSVEEYYTPKPMSADLLNMGITWLKKYKVSHEWVKNGDPESMKQALKLSPLGAAVYAWRIGPNGYYIRGGEDTHWICIYGYVDGQYWKCFDSYDQTHKKLDWNFGFSSVKRYHIDYTDENKTQQISIIEKLILLLQKLIQTMGSVIGLWKR